MSFIVSMFYSKLWPFFNHTLFFKSAKFLQTDISMFLSFKCFSEDSSIPVGSLNKNLQIELTHIIVHDYRMIVKNNAALLQKAMTNMSLQLFL